MPLLITSSAYVVNPGLYARIPHDSSEDSAPIVEFGTSPNVEPADPKLGVNSTTDLVARAKAKWLKRRSSYATMASRSSPNGPDNMKKRIDAEVPRWCDIIAKAGIKPV